MLRRLLPRTRSAFESRTEDGASEARIGCADAGPGNGGHRQGRLRDRVCPARAGRPGARPRQGPEPGREHPPRRHRAASRRRHRARDPRRRRRGLRAGLQLDGDARAMGPRRGDLRASERDREPASWRKPPSGRACGASSTPRRTMSSTRTKASASTRRRRRAIRRARLTSAPSSAQRSWSWRRATAMEVVILNPSGVYGPTPSPTPSFENGLFEPVVRKRLPAVPPGGTGYAFAEGVAAGHLLAADHGRDGERYILADGYASFREIAETVSRRCRPGARPAGDAGSGGACGRPQSARRSRASSGARRCSPADSSATSSGRATPIPPRRRASSAGRPPRSPTASARRSTQWACSKPAN